MTWQSLNDILGSELEDAYFMYMGKNSLIRTHWVKLGLATMILRMFIGVSVGGLAKTCLVSGYVESAMPNGVGQRANGAIVVESCEWMQHHKSFHRDLWVLLVKINQLHKGMFLRHSV